MRIIDRIVILGNGFNEENKMVRKTFLEVLIPKWLSAYNGDFLKLINAIKLDADEHDIKLTASVSEKVLEVLFK